MSRDRFRKGPPSPEHPTPSKMVAGEFYDLHPPANIKGKIFKRIKCEWRAPFKPGKPDSYMVCGIPEGGEKIASFVLEFSDEWVTVTPAPERDFEAPKKPKLHRSKPDLPN